ncbi:hypothetical protein DWQ65_02065 [Treponema phagedenis]|uniref:Uncharacterized protein n=1 Tax=Treponema phagedenis TaxID=162 RepID=A0AAE6IRZ4_TREPH|nr:hypothetical protein FUT79_01090 [Treponema phagedenis]QEJ96731.1 hypothetical protein FUT82_01045 [Treponema phagedenis]QEJ96802.1 hypothetical protein FUT82_01585 [Treponema phagedenis]QEJ96891.1 hypothetical protein FUT82_02100 [Treponema phagedenis]QEK02045.1 hypothetical protein FUT84_13315 [Treponema phagedenis]
MVPNRIEFENYHSYINRSFQTYRFHFDTDGKMKPLCRALFIIWISKCKINLSLRFFCKFYCILPAGF